MAIKKNSANNKCWRDCGEMRTLDSKGDVVRATNESTMELPWKGKRWATVPVNQSYPLLGLSPEKMKIKNHRLAILHSSNIYHRQHLEVYLCRIEGSRKYPRIFQCPCGRSLSEAGSGTRSVYYDMFVSHLMWDSQSQSHMVGLSAEWWRTCESLWLHVKDEALILGRIFLPDWMSPFCGDEILCFSSVDDHWLQIIRGSCLESILYLIS